MLKKLLIDYIKSKAEIFKKHLEVRNIITEKYKEVIEEMLKSIYSTQIVIGENRRKNEKHLRDTGMNKEPTGYFV